MCASAQPLTPVEPAASPSPPAADTLEGDTLDPRLSRADTARVVRHHFNHRRQIIAGSVIMASLAGIMAIMNNYNPR